MNDTLFITPVRVDYKQARQFSPLRRAMPLVHTPEGCVTLHLMVDCALPICLLRLVM